MISLYVIIILQVLDILTTVKALSMPGLVEGNNLLKPLMDKIGVVPALLLVKLIFIGFLVYFYKDIAEPALYLVIVVYLAIIGNNIKLILGAR